LQNKLEYYKSQMCVLGLMTVDYKGQDEKFVSFLFYGGRDKTKKWHLLWRIVHSENTKWRFILYYVANIVRTLCPLKYMKKDEKFWAVFA